MKKHSLAKTNKPKHSSKDLESNMGSIFGSPMSSYYKSLTTTSMVSRLIKESVQVKLIVFFMLVQVDLILVLVFAYVLDMNYV